MKVAITVWENRISPVFEAAGQILLVDMEKGKISKRGLVAVNGDPFIAVSQLRKTAQIELLLCGALCQRGRERLQSDGLDVIPFLSGELDIVLQALQAGKNLDHLAMPGCRRQCCCRRRQRQNLLQRCGIRQGGKYE